jgi:phosphoribosyl 1,2-cyclic phosphate phosphodiesterase
MSYPSFTVTFLGTGTSSGVPMIGCDCVVCTSKNKKDHRLRSSVLIQSNSTTIVIDTTPDFRYQMLRENVRHVDAIIYTHPHKDHMAGLDDVRAYNLFSGKPMEIFCNTLTEEAIRRDFFYAFSDRKYPGVPDLHLNSVSEQLFTIGDLTIHPILVWHLHMPVLGFRFGPFTYITDANRIDEPEREKIRGSQTLVMNALRKQPHLSHFTLDEAVSIADELNIPQTYFTHISHQLGLHDSVNSSLAHGRALAYDGLILKF